MTGGASSFGAAGPAFRRYKWIAAVVGFAFVLLVARLWQLQIMQGERYYRRSADNFVKDIELPAVRGQLRDRKGRVLVDNRPAYNVYVTPRFLDDAAYARLKKILELGDEQVELLKQRVVAKKGLDRFQQLLAFEDVSRDQMGALESDRDLLPGVSVVAVAHRSYPYGSLAAHTLGYMNQIAADELAPGGSLRDLGYRPGDRIGRSGLERQWEAYLRGKGGFERVVVDAKGHVKSDLEARELEALIGGPHRKDPEPGDDLVTTLDLDLEQTMQKALARHHSAAAAVVDVNTGRVLAIASHPSFDPNLLGGHLSRADAEALEKDPLRPLVDKALRENFYPASTFKVVPSLVGLEDKLVDPGDKVVCRGGYELGGRTFRCMKAHGPVNLYQALVQSCNTYFFQLGEKVGMDRMARLANDLGLGAPTGVGLTGEVPGFVPTQDYYKKQGGFRIGYTLNTAIGQGSTKVTVLQMALAYAAIANGGDLYVPELVERIETPSGAVVQEFPPRQRRHLAVAPENLEEVKRGLCGVVNDPKGTAHSAWLPTLPEVCGKSGTAQSSSRHCSDADGWEHACHAWFVGYAPAKNPQVAIAVVIEHGGLGGHVAGPTAMRILQGWFDRAADAQLAAPPPGAAPNPEAAAATTTANTAAPTAKAPAPTTTSPAATGNAPTAKAPATTAKAPAPSAKAPAPSSTTPAATKPPALRGTTAMSAPDGAKAGRTW